MVLLFDINLTPPQEQDDAGRDLDLDFSPHTPEHAAQLGHVPEEEHQEQEHDAEPEQILEEEQEHGVQRHHKDIPESYKFAAYIALKALGNDRPVVKADKEIVAQLLGISLRSVEKTWKKAIDQEDRNEVLDFSNKRKGRCGRKRRELNLDERVPKVPLNKRGTLRALARSLDVPFSTLQRRLAWGDLRRHTNSLKPYLSLENRLRRLLYCISMIDEPSITDAKLIFKMMGNIMHMDEKWFDMTKRNRTYYLTPEEPDPVRTIHNHNNIGKVMFLTLVARPRFDAQGNMTFDGKVGIWAFVVEDVAKYNSKYQTKGDLMLKNLNVTRDVMREYLCEKVIPAIVEVWPDDGDVGTIWIQQDNARTHVPPDDPIFQAAVKASGLDIRLTFQPPNSPDVNVLDLCFFSSIQSLAFESAPNTLKELIESVEQAYDAYDVNTLAKVYVTLQSVLVQIMKNQGGNTYKIIHMGKDKLIKEGNLPDTLEVDSELYEETLKLIEEYENQLKEEEETKIKVAQAKKTSKRKGRFQLIVDDDTIIAAKEYSTWLKDPSSIIRPSRRVKTKLDLIRETQIGEFEAAIQPRIEEEKPKQEKRKGKQPLIEKEKPKEKKRIKRSKL
ncbi:hypothetical protein QYE76_069278 [Lolium multiflorum]|uniref:Transposase n=1 Tax=Lolium multiflorum TaxID=4521 RepID=A0AAD8SH36_LOLMU|nr:hypothetical protein QYE76_069278 [Lolium multiflorum]